MNLLLTTEAQSTEQSVFYGFIFVSFISVYGQHVNLWTNLRIFRLTAIIL